MEAKILVIDDLEGIFVMLKHIYEPKGIKVLSTLSLDEALEIFKKENPQIVVLETYVFGTSEEFLKEVRRLSDKVVRIIFTTIHPPGYEERCFEKNLCEYYFHKPLSDEEGKRMEKAIISEAYKA
jgi:two-component SAPR family response regulator